MFILFGFQPIGRSKFSKAPQEALSSPRFTMTDFFFGFTFCPCELLILYETSTYAENVQSKNVIFEYLST
jgi:hypothetical protein